ncbi:MAG: M28 family peptidase [Lentisphaeria bacterium]|nr:M28 family peptidase [Lentisphaeria bacterium]
MKHPRIEAIRNVFSLSNLQDLTLTLAEFERTSSYSRFDASTRYVMEMLERAGFSKIERLTHKADGKSSAMDCIMPEAWDLCGHSFLQIVSPEVPEYDRILADSDRHPQEAVIWSAPTPEGGVEGEVLTWKALDPEHPETARGKWVLLESEDGTVNGSCYRTLAETGAAGLIVTDFTVAETCPDDAVWFNGQGLNSWYHEKEAPRLPVFSVPPRRARKLLELLKKGPVSVRGEMRSRIYDGEICTVTAVIPGETAEEYALFAHIYEPFAADDALGFAAACEMGRVMVQRGVKPKKTLRVVISMELYGFSAFLADPKRRRRIVAALSLDSVSYSQPQIDFRRSPIPLPFFADWFYRDWFGKHLPSFGWSETRGDLGDDTFAGDPDIGIPTNWVRSPCGDYHHNTGRPFEPDWRLVEAKFPVLAGAVEALVTDGPTGNYSRRAAREMKSAAAAMLKDPALTGFEKTVRLETEYRRYAAMLASWEKFTGRKADLGPLDAAYEALRSKTGPIRFELFSTAEWRAHGIVPERLRLGAPFGLSEIPYAERRKTAVPRLLWALFDGRRDLLTCIRIMDADRFPHPAAADRGDRQRSALSGEIRLRAAAPGVDRRRKGDPGGLPRTRDRARHEAHRPQRFFRGRQSGGRSGNLLPPADEDPRRERNAPDAGLHLPAVRGQGLRKALRLSWHSLLLRDFDRDLPQHAGGPALRRSLPLLFRVGRGSRRFRAEPSQSPHRLGILSAGAAGSGGRLVPDGLGGERGDVHARGGILFRRALSRGAHRGVPRHPAGRTQGQAPHLGLAGTDLPRLSGRPDGGDLRTHAQGGGAPRSPARQRDAFVLPAGGLPQGLRNAAAPDRLPRPESPAPGLRRHGQKRLGRQTQPAEKNRRLHRRGDMRSCPPGRRRKFRALTG